MNKRSPQQATNLRLMLRVTTMIHHYPRDGDDTDDADCDEHAHSDDGKMRMVTVRMAMAAVMMARAVVLMTVTA